MDLKQTKAAVEAMLFAHAEPVTAERLAGVLGVEEDAVSRLLLSLRDDEVQRFSLEALYALLEGRNAQRPEGSYTTYLFEKGREKILKKVGEECTEVIIGAMKGSREETIYEISDLCYHVLVLMVAEGITLDDIRAELASRHVSDHKVKQETMQ